MNSEAKQDFTLFHALNVQPYTKDVRPAVIGVLLGLCHKQRYFKLENIMVQQKCIKGNVHVCTL